MSARDPDIVLAAWLDEGPTDLPDATRRAILTAIPLTKQVRRGPFAPWRPFKMNPIARVLAAAAVLVVAVAGTFYLSAPRPNVGGPGVNSTPVPTPSLQSVVGSASPAPSVNPLDTTRWQSFASPIHGYSARYPAGWKAVPATAPASLANLTDAVGGVYDHFSVGGGTYPDIIGTSTAIPKGMTEDQWIAAYRAPVVAQFGDACFPVRSTWEAVTVGGHPGGLYSGCAYVESTIFVGGRAYVFTVDLGLGGQVTDETRQLLRAFLSTVVIHVGTAVPLPSATPHAS